MITLRQLRYFAALARYRHFGRAADACAITQPALSMQIRDLEKELGIDLVERRPSDIVLTDVGVEVARRADSVLMATRDLVDFARQRGVLAGALRLGIIPTLAPYLLPRVLPRLQAAYAQVRLEVRETQTRVLLDELARGDLDCVMLALPVDAAEVETMPLFDDAFLLAVPAAEARTLRGPVTLEDVELRRLILLEEGHCLRDQALALCAAQRPPGQRLAPAGLAATSLSTVMQMVANGYGVTLLPEVAVDVEARDERIRLLRFRRPAPARSIGLAWRRTSPRRGDFEALGKTIIDAVQNANSSMRKRKAI
jgi:LysR family transcriptional regulator, hydrogen peroxide-inducible genes activator